jgi:hypothetical protein
VERYLLLTLDGVFACGVCSGMARSRRVSNRVKRGSKRAELAQPKWKLGAGLPESRKRDGRTRGADALEELWAEVKALREQVRKAERKKLH